MRQPNVYNLPEPNFRAATTGRASPVAHHRAGSPGRRSHQHSSHQATNFQPTTTYQTPPTPTQTLTKHRATGFQSLTTGRGHLADARISTQPPSTGPRVSSRSPQGGVTGSGLISAAVAGSTFCGCCLCSDLSVVGSGSAFPGSGLGAGLACLGFGSAWPGRRSPSSSWRLWFWRRVVCMSRPVSGICGCGCVAGRVQTVAAVKVLDDAPVVVMDIVMAVPADHDQVLDVGGASL